MSTKGDDSMTKTMKILEKLQNNSVISNYKYQLTRKLPKEKHGVLKGSFTTT